MNWYSIALSDHKGARYDTKFVHRHGLVPDTPYLYRLGIRRYTIYHALLGPYKQGPNTNK